MRKEEKERIENGWIPTVGFLEKEILKSSPDLVRILIKAGVAGKGIFGSRANLTEEEIAKGSQLVPIEKQLDMCKYLLDKVWKSSEGNSDTDSQKSQEEIMKELGVDP